VPAALGQALGLTFYSKAILCPLYLVALGILVPESLGRRERPLRVLTRDWPLGIALGLPIAAYLGIVATGGYGAPPGHATLTQWSQFARVAWLRGDAPVLIGQNVPAQTTTLNEVAVVVAQVVVALLVALSLARSLRAWRGWAWLAAGAVPNAIMVGAGRLHLFGPSIGQDLRYVAELAFLWPLAIVLAFGVSVTRGASGRLAMVAVTVRRLAATPAGMTAIAIAFLASYAGTLHRLAAAWPTERSAAFAARIRADAARLRAAGDRPAVIDGPAPFDVVAGIAPPFNTIATVLPEIDPRIPVNQPGHPLVTVAGDGALEPVELALRAQDRSRSGRCLRTSGRIAWAPRASAATVEPLLVRLTMRPRRRQVAVPVFVDRGNGFPAVADRRLVVAPGLRSGIVDAGSTSVAGLLLDLPADAGPCVTGVALLAYRPRA
jgi:hypothetical protein